MTSLKPVTAESLRAVRLRLRWSLPFAAALLPIILLALYAVQIASQSVRDLVESGNRAAASNVLQLLTQDFDRTVNLAQAIASVPGTVEAVRKKDDIAMRARLKAVVLAYPQIDRVFVTDRSGVLWTDYPQAPGVFGRSQAESDWYSGLSRRWKPYVSHVYVRPFDAASPVTAIATPVHDEAGRVIGALVIEYRTDQVQRWLRSIRLGTRGHVYVLDQGGTVVAHPNLPQDGPLEDAYANVDILRASQSGGIILTRVYPDPLTGERMVATFQPLSLGSSRWMIVSQQPEEEAFALLNQVKLNLGLAGLILTLFTTGMVVALALSARRITLLNEELAAKNRTLRDITSFVSHQLRAPVTAMKWMLEGILDGDAGDVGGELRKELLTLRDVTVGNSHLIDDILNVSRLDRGVIEVQSGDVPLRDIVERALRDERPAIERANLRLTTEGMEQEVLVHADKEKMAEAITNSISNALKHTRQGGITVRLRKDDRQGYVDVADTGEGMPPEMLGRLFRRSGVKAAGTDSAQSTGLGLFIARSFMQLQGGDITVSSEPGKGTVFTYSIPLASAALTGGNKVVPAGIAE